MSLQGLVFVLLKSSLRSLKIFLLFGPQIEHSLGFRFGQVAVARFPSPEFVGPEARCAR